MIISNKQKVALYVKKRKFRELWPLLYEGTKSFSSLRQCWRPEADFHDENIHGAIYPFPHNAMLFRQSSYQDNLQLGVHAARPAVSIRRHQYQPLVKSRASVLAGSLLQVPRASVLTVLSRSRLRAVPSESRPS